MLANPSHSKRLHFLDSLRGIAALLVVFHHFMVLNGKHLQLIVSKPLFQIFSFVSDLNVEAVLFFFVLSGFSIGLAQKGKFLKNGKETNTYFYKRFKRILPIYWLSLAFAIFIGLLINEALEPSYSISNLMGNLLFLQTSATATAFWFSPYGNNGPLWTLAYELFFYLFFPLISLIVYYVPWVKKREILWLSLIFLSFLAIGINKYVIFIPPLAFLSYFIVWWSGFQIATDYFQHRQSSMFWLIIIVVCLFIQFFKHQVPSTTILEIAKGLLIASIFHFLLVINTLLKNSLINNIKIIINLSFKQVGHASYALYALHYPLYLLLDYYDIHWIYQIISIFGLLLLCIWLEKWIANKSFLIFKLNYMRIKSLNIG